jgi:hypothetical protein
MRDRGGRRRLKRRSFTLNCQRALAAKNDWNDGKDIVHAEVLVADENGQPLSKCTQARAEMLLERGQAVMISAAPLSIRLTRPRGNGAPPSPSSGLNGNQKKKRKRKVARLRARDGSVCFYCGEIVPNDDTTIEHLVAKSDGGSDHPSNLVLAHSRCNEMAADKPVIEKVLLRESLRQKARTRTLDEVRIPCDRDNRTDHILERQE